MWAKASTQRFATKRVTVQNCRKSHALAEWRCNRLIVRAKRPNQQKMCGASLCTIEILARFCPLARQIEQNEDVFNYHFAQICMPGGSPVN
jgi:hypothetical protein